MIVQACNLIKSYCIRGIYNSSYLTHKFSCAIIFHIYLQ